MAWQLLLKWQGYIYGHYLSHGDKNEYLEETHAHT